MNILFLCTGNSCRSQMAEGWARHLDLPDLHAYSAGIVAKGLDPRAVKVMAEAGVNIGNQKSKTLGDLPDVIFDCVITLCGHANETCPVSPDATRLIHRGFDDPPVLAQSAKDENEALEHYRRVRDEIDSWMKTLPEDLDHE